MEELKEKITSKPNGRKERITWKQLKRMEEEDKPLAAVTEGNDRLGLVVDKSKRDESEPLIAKS